MGHTAQMRLRAEPPPVTRLSRRVLVSVAVAGSLTIGGVLIYALQSRDGNVGSQELHSINNRPTADGLSGLPRDYAGPILGPPLPGDLGGAIVDAQNRGQPIIVSPIETATVDEAEQRRLADEEAARTSRVFFQTQSIAAAPLPLNTAMATPNLAGLPLYGQDTPQTEQDRQLAFLNAEVDRRTVAEDTVVAPASPYIVQAGSVIPAALITGIRSDLPGQITAQVTQHIYDSPTGSLLLIPQGTRIIGEYDNGVAFGQRRILLVWNRLILPNGRSIILERQPGADTGGYAGLEDQVDYHWWDMAKAAGLSTLLTIGAELTMDNEDRLIRALRSGAQDTINDVGQRIIQQQMQVAPTLTIRPGFPVRVIVTRDLVLEPYGGA
ncbi:MAG: conjugal transfer protein TraI [Pelagibacterium sp. SCN 64-44]|nr:MAG: conjugal transfer protein TraI [Pelagibacterium sp. SCN 64-44]